MAGSDPAEGYRWANRGIACALVAALLLPLAAGYVSVPCAVMRATGAPCVSCGLTRSLAAVYRGELSLSVSLHPAGVVFVVLVMFELAARWFVERNLARRPGIAWLDLAQLVTAVLVFDAMLRLGAPLRALR